MLSIVAGLASTVIADVLIPYVLVATLLSVLLGGGEKIRGLFTYFAVLSVLVVPINLRLLGFAFSGLPEAQLVFLAFLPLLRIYAVTIGFILATLISDPYEIFSSLSRVMPRSVALSLTLAFSLVPTIADEVRRLREVQMLKGVALLPVRERIPIEAKTLFSKAVTASLLRAQRISEALEIYF